MKEILGNQNGTYIRVMTAFFIKVIYVLLIHVVYKCSTTMTHGLA
jgi:hypothetical protein